MRVKIYTTPNCPFSEKLREFLRKKGIEYEEVNVLEDEKAFMEMVEVSGQTSVPVLVVEKNGETKVVGGFDENKLKEVFFENEN